MTEPQWGAGCIRMRKGKPCGRAARTRGLCPACYQRVYLMVRASKTTWEKEVKAGRALVAIKPHQTGMGKQVSRQFAKPKK